MSDNAIAMKYGTHNIDNILATLPLEEAEPLIREYLRKEVESEISDRYEDRISEAEEEAWEQEQRADDIQYEIEKMAELIEKALSASSLDEIRAELLNIKDEFSHHF